MTFRQPFLQAWRQQKVLIGEIGAVALRHNTLSIDSVLPAPSMFKNSRTGSPLSTMVRWNTPIVRAYYLKESFQLFWDYRQPGRAKSHLKKWMRSAMGSRLDPFKRFVRMLRDHLDGILPWTSLRLSNGAVEAMNNKIKSISHRSFGFRSAQNFIAAIYHCCAWLPLPVER